MKSIIIKIIRIQHQIANCYYYVNSLLRYLYKEEIQSCRLFLILLELVDC